MFRVNPRATLGPMIFTILIKKSEKLWRFLRDCMENLPKGGPSGNQTFLQGSASQESLITLGTSQGQIFPDNPFGLSTVCTRPLNNSARDSSVVCRPPDLGANLAVFCRGSPQQ